MKQSMSQIINTIDELLEEYIDSQCAEVVASQLGLDSRAGYVLYVSHEGVLVLKTRAGALDYYGGFEYVDKDARTEIGEYIFYSCKDKRVRECLNHFSTYYTKLDNQ